MWKLDIDVERILRGVEPRRHIVAYAMAEAEIKQHLDFVFFLIVEKGGGYGVLMADLDPARAKSELRRCDKAPAR